MMSKPAVHSVTAAVSHRMRGSSEPRIGDPGRRGRDPEEKPSTRCENDVNRLVKE